MAAEAGPAALPPVGPVLEASELGRRIAETIADADPAVRIVDRGAYLRIEAPGRCVLPRAAVERRLGRAFVLPQDLEALMPSFRGRLTVDDDQAVWTCGTTP